MNQKKIWFMLSLFENISMPLFKFKNSHPIYLSLEQLKSISKNKNDKNTFLTVQYFIV